MMTFFHKELEPIKGRRFFVGDIHGKFDLLLRFLDRVNFDPSCDGVAATGDTINRGELSSHVLWWLAQPWFDSVLGNNEFKLIVGHDTDTLNPETTARGSKWFCEMDHAERQRYVDAFKNLPLALTVPVGFDKVGVVHGEVIGSWQMMLAGIQVNDKEIIARSMEGRTRVRWNRNSRVTGVLAVIAGHTPVQVPEWHGNSLYIDTAAVRTGRLTVIDGYQVLKEARFVTEANELIKKAG